MHFLTRPVHSVSIGMSDTTRLNAPIEQHSDVQY